MAAASGSVAWWRGLDRAKGLTRSSAALLFFNLLDGLFTLTFLQLGLATEANPVMRLAYDGSPLGFMFAKLMLVNAGVLVLNVHGSVRAARLALHTGAVLYAAVVAYHLSFVLKLSGA